MPLSLAGGQGLRSSLGGLAGAGAGSAGTVAAGGGGGTVGVVAGGGRVGAVQVQGPVRASERAPSGDEPRPVAAVVVSGSPASAPRWVGGGGATVGAETGWTTGIAGTIGGGVTWRGGRGRAAWRCGGAGAGRAVITIDGEVVWGRLSGLSTTAAGPSSREGVSSRPIPVVSESATTAPCAQESLMSSPDLADNNCWMVLSAARGWVLRP